MHDAGDANGKQMVFGLKQCKQLMYAVNKGLGLYCRCPESHQGCRHFVNKRNKVKSTFNLHWGAQTINEFSASSLTSGQDIKRGTFNVNVPF